MKTILTVTLIVLVALFMFVKGLEIKCANIAKIGKVDVYYFSPIRGCELQKDHMVWLMTPGYLLTYRPTETMWIWEP